MARPLSGSRRSRVGRADSDQQPLPHHPFPLPRWGTEFPEKRIRALKPLNRGKTSNVQHRTPNAEVGEEARCHSMFGVGCSMLDVPPGSWGGNTSKIRT